MDVYNPLMNLDQGCLVLGAFVCDRRLFEHFFDFVESARGNIDIRAELALDRNFDLVIFLGCKDFQSLVRVQCQISIWKCRQVGPDIGSNTSD